MINNGVDVEENLPVPTITEEVTEDWLVKALKLDLEKGKLVITSNIHAGSGYLSNMLRAKAPIKNSQGETEEHSFVIKLLPEGKVGREMVVSEKMDKSELGMYEKLFPELVKQVPSLKPYFCPYLYGKIQEENIEKGIEYSSVLVLKDLKCDGYFAKPFTSHKLSPEELKSGVDFLAKFHAAGNLVEIEKGKRLNELFDFFPEWYYPNDIKNGKLAMQDSFDRGFGHARQFIEDYITKVNPEASETGNMVISEMIDALEPHSEKIWNFILNAAQQHPTAIHGDVWQNNILFPSGSNSQIIVIDWQLLGYSDPVIDLAMILTMSLQEDELTRDNVEHYARLYYNKVEELYNQRISQGLSVPPNRRSWSKFWEDLNTFGVSYSGVLIIACSELLVTNTENNAKLTQFFAFLHKEMKITNYMLKNVT